MLTHVRVHVVVSLDIPTPFAGTDEDAIAAALLKIPKIFWRQKETGVIVGYEVFRSLPNTEQMDYTPYWDSSFLDFIPVTPTVDHIPVFDLGLYRDLAYCFVHKPAFPEVEGPLGSFSEDPEIR